MRTMMIVALLIAGGCVSDDKPQRRTRSSSHDASCKDAARPQAFMYPATNREFGPDNPKTDGCELAVPDHLFCCPATSKPTDR
jgi:hypothetical protein